MNSHGGGQLAPNLTQRLWSAVFDQGKAEWRELCKMRTAVVLLAIVGGLSIIATMLPQRALQPVRASGWIQGHQVLGPIFDQMGLFSVYDSWPLLLAAGLMYVSLSHCVFVRGRALLRRWRRRLPRNSQFIGEVGSLVFHLSFFVLLIGIVWGKAAGFTAYVDVVEGQSIVEARPSYDQIEEGLFFTAEQHRGFEVRVDNFNVSYFTDGRPKDFVSHVEVFDRGVKVDEKRIRVNDYLSYQDVKFYQASYGWAPVIRVFDPLGKKVFDGPVVFFGDPRLSNGILKVPAAGPPKEQLGALMFLIPDLQQTSAGATAGTANPINPALSVRMYQGDLQSDRAQNVYQLNTTRMSQVWKGGIQLGESALLPGGYRMEFSRLSRYTGLQVTDDPGLGIIWASFMLMLGGLMVRLYLAPLLDTREKRRPVADPHPGPPKRSPGSRTAVTEEALP